MSIDEAKNLLFQIHFEGNLRKKGFRGLQMWKRRYFRILGSTLIYFDVNNLKVARRTSEITADGKVMVENIPDHPYAFSIIPNKSERLYNVEAYSTQQRVMIPFLPHSSQDQWIRLISLIIALNRRIYAPNPNSRRSIHDSFRILDTLGKGRYGVVHLGQQISTGEVFAIKVIHRGNIDASVLRQELLVLRAVKNRIHSEHIARIVDIYEDPLLVHIVMEYLGGGDLYHRVAKKGCFSEREAANVIRRIGSALEELHKEHIFHLDVKPENIIYESNDSHSPMKLADFGCSLLMDRFNRDTKCVSEVVGTAGFMAPEVISNCAYSEKADVYSLGVTLFILLMGYPPFSGETQSELLHQTVHDRVKYEEKDWEAVSRDALILVKNMLCKNPNERISMREVLTFPWVTNPPASVGEEDGDEK
ncbi:uncharacterized protein [Blastocystis hominis]|uniref:Protein kinase domain-containing protein n=1 Tax=Blastocystis hominis TaxID=12968 RepID=D8M218_BLAHO|nr:uncharacterized protein [Blastocystis hominis]CBK22107.2 unnamed protein product [Blastocystis hominis]|eukprot:XP_012896155.1 uncharacterized protein [Blastocystis hominis]